MGRDAALPGLIILVTGILGLLIAFIEQLAYDNSWILDQYITIPSMLPGLQILTVVIFLLAGCVLAAFTSS